MSTYPITSLAVSDLGVVLSASGVATTQTSADQYNSQYRGIKLFLNVTALTGTGPTLTLTLQGKDSASGQYYTVLASTAIGAVGFTTYTVFPGGPVAANVSANDFLPATWRLSAVIGGATPAATFTVGAVLM